MNTVRPEELRSYIPNECVVFCKTKEAFGGYSNMCSGYPLRVNDVDILTSEALYQAFRFPDYPELQKMIIAQRSPMAAKMKTKPHRRACNRPDWESQHVLFMRWCLRVKLLQHWEKFSALLLQSESLSIVEKSNKGDKFWGAVLTESKTLVGQNYLGRLLMELRENIKQNVDPMSEDFTFLAPLSVPDFLLYGKLIQGIRKQ